MGEKTLVRLIEARMGELVEALKAMAEEIRAAIDASGGLKKRA